MFRWDVWSPCPKRGLRTLPQEPEEPAQWCVRSFETSIPALEMSRVPTSRVADFFKQCEPLGYWFYMFYPMECEIILFHGEMDLKGSPSVTAFTQSLHWKNGGSGLIHPTHVTWLQRRLVQYSIPVQCLALLCGHTRFTVPASGGTVVLVQEMLQPIFFGNQTWQWISH